MKSVFYFYKVYDLIIRSQIELSELFLSEDTANPDITIRFGDTPERLVNPIESHLCYQFTKEEYLLQVHGIANYYLKSTNEIIIKPLGYSEHLDIKVFLLNQVLPFLLRKKNYFILHGSAVLIEGKAVLFLGASSAGKTLIALELIKRGCMLLSDEYCVIKMIDGSPLLISGVPQLNVWQDSLIFQGEESTNYSPIRKGLNKYAFDAKAFYFNGMIPIATIFILKADNLKNHISKIKGAKKLKSLLVNAKFISANNETCFLTAVSIANSANMFELGYIRELNLFRVVVDSLLKEITTNE